MGHQLIQSSNSVWDTSQSNLPTRLGYQLIQSFNSVGIPADSIFQLSWDTNLFNLSTGLGHQQIQSFNSVGTPADSIFVLGLGYQLIQSFTLDGTPADSIFQLGLDTSRFSLSTWVGDLLILFVYFLVLWHENGRTKQNCILKQKLWASVRVANGCYLALERTREEAMCRHSHRRRTACRRAVTIKPRGALSFCSRAPAMQLRASTVML
jgi:hypothetical protein